MRVCQATNSQQAAAGQTEAGPGAPPALPPQQLPATSVACTMTAGSAAVEVSYQ